MDKFIRTTPVEAERTLCEGGTECFRVVVEAVPFGADFRRDHVPACPMCEGTGKCAPGACECVGFSDPCRCEVCKGSGRSTWAEYDGRLSARDQSPSD